YYEIKGPYSFIKIGDNEFKKRISKVDNDINNEITIKMIEERYKRENEFLEAVSRGDFPLAYLAYEKMMANMAIYYNFDDRGTKARGITILSTLLRKAAQIGGVHPLHLENISSKYTLISLSKFKLDERINAKMIKDYCALVKEYSLKSSSPLARDAANYIHFNLSSNLTVSNIADYLCITPNYLYRIFKKEYNTSVIDYINKKRIKESIKLMKENDMQIQEIAEKVGFNDISYFSRLFKREIGRSPSKYKKDLGQ
ncbi:MAG: helix-turn-helix domain-containing protein, partial [Peptostreptococcaceae bacterium]